MKLESKICLITGGTRGIGAATAVALATQGADVALVGRHLDDEAEATRDLVAQSGRRCFLIHGDMSRAEDAARCVDETVEALGGLDVLIHSAGGPAPGGFMDVSPETWYNAFDTHVHAVFHLARATVPFIRQRGEGAIILISSAAGLRGCLGASAYGVVKGALIHFTRVLARELAENKIRVNCVAPGIIRTRFHQNMTPEQQQNNLMNRIPLHREGTSEDVADAILMLVRNEFITGETITIDGGMTMRIV
jgi:NAD(P)-dependent dehydrogenase (short-subunit alcohol dehydrogenase family)